MSRVLVIGANGFIGSRVVDQLVALGHEVTGFDRFGSGRYNFARHADVRIIAGEFLNESELAAAVAGQDAVLHFLSTSTPASTQREPRLDVRTNVLQTVALLESCVAAGVDHFYFASTGGAIYGPQPTSVFTEEHPTLPISPYGIGKLTIERYLDYFTLTHGLASTVFRISNPYGAGQRERSKQGVIPIALRNVKAGAPVVRMGDGSMVRDYIYVEDVAAIVARFVGRQTKHSIYNIGSGTGTSINELFATMKRVTGIDFPIDEVEKPRTFVDRVTLDISRLRAELDDLTFTSLDDGIRVTWQGMTGERG